MPGRRALRAQVLYRLSEAAPPVRSLGFCALFPCPVPLLPWRWKEMFVLVGFCAKHGILFFNRQLHRFTMKDKNLAPGLLLILQDSGQVRPRGGPVGAANNFLRTLLCQSAHGAPFASCAAAPPANAAERSWKAGARPRPLLSLAQRLPPVIILQRFLNTRGGIDWFYRELFFFCLFSPLMQPTHLGGHPSI